MRVNSIGYRTLVTHRLTKVERKEVKGGADNKIQYIVFCIVLGDYVEPENFISTTRQKFEASPKKKTLMLEDI